MELVKSAEERPKGVLLFTSTASSKLDTCSTSRRRSREVEQAEETEQAIKRCGGVQQHAEQRPTVANDGSKC